MAVESVLVVRRHDVAPQIGRVRKLLTAFAAMRARQRSKDGWNDEIVTSDKERMEKPFLREFLTLQIAGGQNHISLKTARVVSTIPAHKSHQLVDG